MKIQTWHANGKVNGRNFFLIDRLCVRKLSLQKQKHRDFLFYYAYAHNFVVDFVILGSIWCITMELCWARVLLPNLNESFREWAYL